MARVRTAKAIPKACFEVFCPHCGESMESPSGSLIWYPEEEKVSQSVQRCTRCKEISWLPKAVRGEGERP